MKYKDLRDHIKDLEERGLLYKIDKEIDKNTELHPLVRLQFRGLEEKQRKAFLFENVVDATGKKYNFPVLVGGVAANREIYALGMQCEQDEIGSKWATATVNQIQPRIVKDAKAQENVLHINENDPINGAGLDIFPIPVSTPGFDPAPYITCAQWVSEDPITGEKNVGNYRAHVKSPTRVGLNLIGPGQGIYAHWMSAKKLNKPLDVAIVIGGPPSVTYASATKLPPGVDEIAAAGAIVGEAIPVVKCKTSNLYVPADAEIVIEGQVSTEYLEPEGPFGEFMGHMYMREQDYFMDIKCITYRMDAIWLSLISQVSPSESSVMRRMSTEALLLKHLRTNLGISSVKRAICWEPMIGLRRLSIIQMDKPILDQTWRALLGASSFMSMSAKIVIAVDNDIDPEDLESIMWAVAFRSKPHKDMQIVRGFCQGTMPPYNIDENGFIVNHDKNEEESLLLIDATMKKPLPPVSLPRKEYMDKAIDIWEELGLPSLKLKNPWYGYDLGGWSKLLTEEADAAALGKSFDYDERLRSMRINA